MIAALAYTAAALIACGVAAVLPGRRRPACLRFWVRVARYHLTRRRYARRMRGPLPARDQIGPPPQRQWLAVLDAWEAPAARPERTRT